MINDKTNVYIKRCLNSKIQIDYSILLREAFIESMCFYLGVCSRKVFTMHTSHKFVGKTHWSINKVMFLLMDVSIPNRLFNFAWVNPLREGKLNFSSRFSITQRKQKNVINGSFFWHPVLVVKMTSPKNLSLIEFLAVQK